MKTGLRAGEISDCGWTASTPLRVRMSKSRMEDDIPILADEPRTWLHACALRVGPPLIAEDYLVPANAGPPRPLVQGR